MTELVLSVELFVAAAVAGDTKPSCMFRRPSPAGKSIDSPHEFAMKPSRAQGQQPESRRVTSFVAGIHGLDCSPLSLTRRIRRVFGTLSDSHERA